MSNGYGIVGTAGTGGRDWRSVGADHKAILTFLTGEKRAPGLVALIFGQTSAKLVQEQIQPNLEYWHHRSRSLVDFFCIGFSDSGAFDAQKFTGAVAYFERESDWKYSGGTDLVLLNTLAVGEEKRARFDLRSAVVITLEKAIELKAIDSVPLFFERIIATAASDSTTTAESDAEGGRVLRKALAELVIGILPKSIQDQARQVTTFVVKDIAPRPKKQ